MPRDLTGFVLEEEERLLFQLFKTTLTDATVLRYTDCDIRITKDVGDGAGVQVWQEAPGISRGPMKASIGLEIDTMEVEIPNIDLAIGLITRKLATWGRLMKFHGATVDVYLYDEKRDLSGLHSTWTVQAMPKATKDTVSLLLESILGRLDMEIPRTRFQPQCNNALYDSICGVSKATFTEASSVTTATIDTITFPNGGARPDGYFDLGGLTFTSGTLAGLTAKIATHVGQTLALYTPMPEAPQAADTFNIWPGCHKDLADCRDKFGNTRVNIPFWYKHFRGFPYVPDWEKLLG